MKQNIELELQQIIDSDERILWYGQPQQGIVFRPQDFFLIPFSVLWCGFAFFWFIMVAFSGNFVFALFGIPFIAVGLFFVFGRFIIDTKSRARTIYGLTNERIIIKSGLLSFSINSLNIKTLSELELSEKKDGIGTITLGPKNPMNIWGNSMNGFPGVKITPQLELIPEAAKVYKQIIEIQKKK